MRNFIMETQLRKFFVILTLVWLGAGSTAFGQQTCNQNMSETAPSTRFVINGDGTVSDLQTGLMWAQCQQGAVGPDCAIITGDRLFSWVEAVALSQASSDTLGREDWRLPNLKELSSLVEYACERPAINSTVFPNIQRGTQFWSSSAADGGVWTVGFFAGNVAVNTVRSDRVVRLVRGGQ